jgi:hypothetical protein
LFFSLKKQACGREARALRGKSIGGKRNTCGDHPVLPQNVAGHRAPGQASLQRNNFVIGGKRACPPDPENEPCLMVFSRNALASARATPEIQSIFCLLAEK